MPGGAAQTRRELDGWQEWARARGARGLAYVLIDAVRQRSRRPARWPGTCPTPNAVLKPADRGGGAGRWGLRCSSPRSGRRRLVAVAGRVRLEIGRRCDLIDRSAWAPTWVGSPPMFAEEDGQRWADGCTTCSTRTAARVGGQVPRLPGKRAGRRVRHRVQRQRDRRRVHPYPPGRHAARGVRRDRAGWPRCGVAVRLPARKAFADGLPQRRHRLRLGPGDSLAACSTPSVT